MKSKVIPSFWLYVIVYCFAVSHAYGQTIWSEDFDGNGGAGSNWGALNQAIGAQGAWANFWYLSDTENGNAAGACGSAGGGDNTLHLGPTVGDLGAAYEIGCMPGCFACNILPALCINSTSNVRSQSQNINTVGYSGMTLTFNYIEGGETTNDDCWIEYSINGGASWGTLVNTAKTAITACAPQGTWTSFSIGLPVVCENISNLRLAFHWINNADAIGVDPSFAVDDIVISSVVVPLPIELSFFQARQIQKGVQLNWTTTSEINNAFFRVEHSVDGYEWKEIIRLSGAGNSQTMLEYETVDWQALQGMNYYRLVQEDFDGQQNIHRIASVLYQTELGEMEVFPNPANQTISFASNKSFEDFRIYGILGNEYHLPFQSNGGNVVVDVSSLVEGVYLLHGSENMKPSRFVIHR
jgi:hypothetical protein